jgi:putative ABC transport system permease protein
MNAFHLAFLDLTRRPLSSMIAVVSIALSVATAGVLLRISNLAEKRYSTLATGTEAIVGAKSGDLDILLGSMNSEFSSGSQTGYLPMKLFESLRAQAPVQFEDGVKTQPGFIKSISPFVYAGTLAGAPAVGSDESIMNRNGLKLEDGTFPSNIAELAVGDSLARAQNYHVGQIVSVQPLTAAAPGTGPEPQASVLGKSLPFKIVCILAPTGSAWDRQAWITLSSAKVLLSHTRLRNSIWGTDVLNYFLIDLIPQPNSFVQLQALVNDRTVGQVVHVSEAKDRLKQLTGTGRDLGLTIVGLVLLMAALSLASVLMTRFESLSLQLAVLRAIGYSKRQLSCWLLIEGLLLGVVACLIGAGVDAVALPAIREMLSTSLPSAELVSSSILESAPVWMAALVATVISVVVPIVRTYRQDVHTSLRA